MSRNETKQKSKKFLPKIVLGVVLIYLVLGVYNPNLLFFLNDSQKQAVNAFRETYIIAASPVGNGESFDPLKIVALIVLAVSCFIVYKIVSFIISKLKFKSKNAQTVTGLLTNLVKYAIVIYGIIYGLSILGVNTGAIIASLGILSLVIGIGAQTLIDDVITGFFIIFEGQFKVGDVIRLDDYRGTVTAIGIRTTQITDDSGNVEIVNNSDIRNIVNLSDNDTTATVDFTIAGGADLDKVDASMTAAIERVEKAHPELFKVPVQYLGINSFEDNGISLMFVVTADENVIYESLRALRKELYNTIYADEIKMPDGFDS